MTARLIAATLLIAAAGAFASAEDIRVADQGLFERWDADGDGRLVEEELPGEQSRLFAKLVRQGDDNRDGVLSESEWKGATTPRRPGRRPRSPDCPVGCPRTHLPRPRVLPAELGWTEHAARLAVPR